MGKRIRPVGPLDVLPLSSPPAVALWLDLTQQLSSAQPPLRGFLLSWLHLREPAHILVSWGEHGLEGCVQARQSPRSSSWQVRYLAAWGDVARAEAVWEELLAGLGSEAGRHGVTRLLAALPGEEYLELFQRAGYSPFAEERILAWDGTAPTEAQPLEELRPVEAEDLWSVQQLHVSLTPPIVYQAEGCSSDSWQPGPGEEGWVWPGEDRVRAYLRRRRGPQGTTMDLLLDPAFRQYAPALLAFALDGVALPAYLILRSYQGELLQVARRMGFGPFAEQILLAKYLVVRRRQPQPAPARQAERHLGTAPSTPSVGSL